MDSNFPYRTAIKRNKLSAPMRHLSKRISFKKALDYGCGKGDDAEALGMDKYDPHFFPWFKRNQYKLITCNYVLNVIPSPTVRNNVILHIKSLLDPNGKAFITVRRDVKGQSYRGKGKSRTWQGNIKKIGHGAKSIYKCSGFEIYEIYPNGKGTIV